MLQSLCHIKRLFCVGWKCDISGYVLSSLCPIYAVHYERSTTTSNLLQKSLSDVDPRLMATRSHVSLVNSVTPVSTRSAVLIDVEFGSSLILRCRVPEKWAGLFGEARCREELDPFHLLSMCVSVLVPARPKPRRRIAPLFHGHSQNHRQARPHTQRITKKNLTLMHTKS